MAAINVHAGDFKTGKHSRFLFSSFSLAHDQIAWTCYKMEAIPASDLQTIELASEENVKKLGGTIGWGIAGGLLLGPVGLLAGLLAGGRKKEVTSLRMEESFWPPRTRKPTQKYRLPSFKPRRFADYLRDKGYLPK